MDRQGLTPGGWGYSILAGFPLCPSPHAWGHDVVAKGQDLGGSLRANRGEGPVQGWPLLSPVIPCWPGQARPWCSLHMGWGERGQFWGICECLWDRANQGDPTPPHGRGTRGVIKALVIRTLGYLDSH